MPKNSGPDGVLLCLHGGGFVSGSIYTHRKMFGHMAKAAGVRALLVDTFQMAAGRVPEADDAIRRMADWVRPRLGW